MQLYRKESIIRETSIKDEAGAGLSSREESHLASVRQDYRPTGHEVTCSQRQKHGNDLHIATVYRAAYK